MSSIDATTRALLDEDFVLNHLNSGRVPKSTTIASMLAGIRHFLTARGNESPPDNELIRILLNDISQVNDPITTILEFMRRECQALWGHSVWPLPFSSAAPRSSLYAARS